VIVQQRDDEETKAQSSAFVHQKALTEQTHLAVQHGSLD